LSDVACSRIVVVPMGLRKRYAMQVLCTRTREKAFHIARRTGLVGHRAARRM
jgi:hypothetical protein